ncbi:MAG: arginine--tRNA ligase [Firmicutes bacterium]|nr:arginine--tRNA ligase [Bacillota bacterium]
MESKALLRKELREAVARAQEAGRLPRLFVEEIEIETPKDRAHGDLATNLALVLAKAAKMPPRKVAEIIVAELTPTEPILRVETAGPGFINFFFPPSWREEAIRRAIAQGADYGRTAVLAGQRIQVEFVSANPVGPLNVVNARAGALGDSLARILAFAGAVVEREYYINDHGVQVSLLGRSVEARCRELRGETVVFPPEGYQGAYVYDLAREFLAEAPADFWTRPEEERVEICREFALARILARQRADLESYGIRYDRWFSERDLHRSGEVQRVFQSLAAAGHVYEEDGAKWLRTTSFGDDKNRVLLTADGRPTYLLADIAYHLDKLARGYDRIIDIWGPDHHGHVIRMKAALAAAGADPGRLEVLIAQQVNLLREGRPVKMSKRAGEFVTLRELVDEVGNDAARFYFLLRSAESHLDFDLSLAVACSNENPVYYVQYAHARVASIMRQAAAEGMTEDATLLRFPAGKLGLPEEMDLADRVAAFPEVAAMAALWREPHRLTGYLMDLAGAFHAYYNQHRVLTEDRTLAHARLALVRAVQITIANGLNLLGVSAPERM